MYPASDDRDTQRRWSYDFSLTGPEKVGPDGLEPSTSVLSGLLIDELGFASLSPAGAELLFYIFSQCCNRDSILVTINLPFDEWTGSSARTVSPRRRWTASPTMFILSTSWKWTAGATGSSLAGRAQAFSHQLNRTTFCPL